MTLYVITLSHHLRHVSPCAKYVVLSPAKPATHVMVRASRVLHHICCIARWAQDVATCTACATSENNQLQKIPQIFFSVIPMREAGFDSYRLSNPIMKAKSCQVPFIMHQHIGHVPFFFFLWRSLDNNYEQSMVPKDICTNGLWLIHVEVLQDFSLQVSKEQFVPIIGYLTSKT